MGVDPFTIAMVGSTVLQATGALGEGKAGYKSGMYDAAVAEENARLATLDGAMRESAIRREGRQIDGEMIAAMGASGVQLGTGSALEVLRESAYNNELDALTERYNAAAEARGYRLDAARSRAGAKDARKAGFLRAGAAILGGVSQFSSTTRLARAGGAERAAQGRYRQSASGLAMPVPQGGYGRVGPR